MRVSRWAISLLVTGFVMTSVSTRLAAQAAGRPETRVLLLGDSARSMVIAVADGHSDTAPMKPWSRPVTLNLHNTTIGEAFDELNRQSGVTLLYSADYVPIQRRVSLRVIRVSALEAARRIVRGTGLAVQPAGTGALMLVRSNTPWRAHRDSRQLGSVVGRVTDAKTRAAIGDVRLAVEGTPLLGTTDARGQYRIPNITPGRYTVVARRLGYDPTTRHVEVVADAPTSLDFALSPTARRLDQVVVTGTVVPTERRALPTPITVVSADELEGQHLRRVDQVFRSMVPGAISWDLGADNYTNSISVRGTSSLLVGQNRIKIYVDGLEVSNDLFSMIDVNSIERIEIIRGPEASTIYGSDASGGVMQVFTKKGAFGLPRPEVTATVSGTAIQSPYASGSRLRQDYDLSLRGGTQDLTYNLGGSYLRTGDWAPAYRLTAPSFFGSARLHHTPLTIDLTARYTSRTYDEPWNVILRDAGFAPFQSPPNMRDNLHNETYGARVSYQHGAWNTALVMGLDRITQEYHNTRAGPSDSLYTVSLGENEKASVALTSSLQRSLTETVTGSATAGIDHYAYDADGFYAGGALNNSGSINSDPSVPAIPQRIGGANTGTFAQVQLGARDMLFLTAGVRLEWNSGFGPRYGSSVSPRAGLSFVRRLGGVTWKARASYGEATRAPTFGSNIAQPGLRSNPALGPERQMGGDFGLDLTFGDHATVSATYFDQTAKDLIDLVLVDASSAPATFQYQNSGRIANSGIEVEAHAKIGRLDVHGQYSVTHSRVRSLASTYTGSLEVGDKLLAIPEQSGGLTITFGVDSRTVLTGGFTYIGPWTNNDWVALLGFYYAGEPYRGSLRDYWITYPSISKGRVGIQHAFSDAVSAFVTIDNLTDSHRFELDNLTLVPGRQTTVGLRVTR